MKSRTLQSDRNMGGRQHVRMTSGAPGDYSAECRQAGCLPAHGPSGRCANTQTWKMSYTEDPSIPWADSMQQLCCK